MGGLCPAADQIPPTTWTVNGEIDLTVPNLTLTNLTVMKQTIVNLAGVNYTQYDAYPPVPTGGIPGQKYTWSYTDSDQYYLYGGWRPSTSTYEVMAEYTDSSTGLTGVALNLGDTVQWPPVPYFSQFGVSEADVLSDLQTIGAGQYPPVPCFPSFMASNSDRLFRAYPPVPYITGDFWAFSDGRSIGTMTAQSSPNPPPSRSWRRCSWGSGQLIGGGAGRRLDNRQAQGTSLGVPVTGYLSPARNREISIP